MKTCIKYWGGKTQLVPSLLPLIHKHKTYCEPFFGGGALYFSKPPSYNEVINDLNDNMVNFYYVLKRCSRELFEEVDVTLFSEYQHGQAVRIWKDQMDNKIRRAWAVFVLSHQSFSGIIGSSWASSRSRNQATYWNNVKQSFDERYSKRLENTQIFCRDATNVIDLMDDTDTFFFLDPPYINTDMGHYEGYTDANFKNLLDIISQIKGKFLLTSFPSAILSDYTLRNGWITINIDMHRSAGNKPGVNKTEVITMNYKPPTQQLSLF